MISLLVVNYRSAALTVEAIRSARTSTSLPLQVVVVDNSVDREEAERLRGCCDELIVSPANAGYAAAINAGRRRCTGRVIVVSNPDVVFIGDAIDTLARAIDDGADVAGPKLVWDAKEEWLLPPSDSYSVPELLDAALATRLGFWRAWRDRRRIRNRLRFWSHTSSVPVRALSGAVMAISAPSFDETGGFDERFTLYFEETDFLRRMRNVRYVPAARCRHLYNQSAGREKERADAFFVQSERLFLEKWYGRRLARLLKAFPTNRSVAEPPRLSGPVRVEEGDVVVEASPFPTFDLAAGHFPHGNQVEIPPEVWETYRGTALYLRVVRRRTVETLGTWVRPK